MNVLNREIQNVFFDDIFRKEIRIIRIILSEMICFYKIKLILGVIMIIILISFLYKILLPFILEAGTTDKFTHDGCWWNFLVTHR